MKTPFDILRAVISAFTAALNADGKDAVAKAKIEFADLKTQLNDSRLQVEQAFGIPLTADEQQHLATVLAEAAAAPAIVVPPQPVAPNAPEPVSEPAAQQEPAVQPAHSGVFGGLFDEFLARAVRVKLHELDLTKDGDLVQEIDYSCCAILAGPSFTEDQGRAKIMDRDRGSKVVRVH